MDPVQTTIDTYNRIALQYKHRRATDDKDTLKPHLDKFIELIDSGSKKKVLDVGSGAGYDSKYLSENGCETIGIDMSESFIEIAKEVAPKARILKMDMRSIDFPDASFDGIYAAASLIHIVREEAPKVIESFNRILKPDGIVLITVKQGEGEKYVRTIVSDNLLEGSDRFFTFFQLDELIKLVENSGFKVLITNKDQNRDNIWLSVYAVKK